jgi:hypothetical protein
VVADGVPPVSTGISSKDAVAPPDDDVGVIATPVIASTPQRATATDGWQKAHVYGLSTGEPGEPSVPAYAPSTKSAAS